MIQSLSQPTSPTQESTGAATPNCCGPDVPKINIYTWSCCYANTLNLILPSIYSCVVRVHATNWSGLVLVFLATIMCLTFAQSKEKCCNEVS